MSESDYVADRTGARSRAFWLSLALVATLDVLTKAAAHRLLVPQHLPHEVLGNALRFTLVYNPGAAFGLNLGVYSRWIFLTLTVLALVVLGRLYRDTLPEDWPRGLALGLVCGGAVGNLINRIWSAPGVVDFIDVGVGDMRWPTFNFADIGVSIGAFLLAWILWGEERRDTGVRISERGQKEH